MSSSLLALGNHTPGGDLPQLLSLGTIPLHPMPAAQQLRPIYLYNGHTFNVCEDCCAEHVLYYCNGTKETSHHICKHHEAVPLNGRERHFLPLIRAEFHKWHKVLAPDGSVPGIEDVRYSLPQLEERYDHVRGCYRGANPEPIFASNPLGSREGVYFKTCVGHVVNVRGQLRTGIRAEEIIRDKSLAKQVVKQRQAATEFRLFERLFTLRYWPKEMPESKFIVEMLQYYYSTVFDA